MACPVQFFCRGLRAVGLVLLYYVFSIGITFYNKWLMKVSHGVLEAARRFGFSARTRVGSLGMINARYLFIAFVSWGINSGVLGFRTLRHWSISLPLFHPG